ncbi:MAG: DUF2911 domain-containing protein [Rhizobacter sp.]|nr:DUF2911 domain-containing protein [Chlorobiales bacterium]
MTSKHFSFALLALLLCVCTSSFAQTAAPMMKPDSNYTRGLQPRLSPLSMAMAKLGDKGDKYVKITYSRPFKKGREIFGSKLVPYGEVWRTGANEATELTTAADISLAGKTLKAGTYAIFTIPQKDKWTIIISNDTGQWGAFKYDATKDVVRFDVPVAATEGEFEAFTIKFEKLSSDTMLSMFWDKTKVSIPVKAL